MIITRTPFRVSLAGGGTDLEAYYRDGFGAVLSLALRSHMYVTAHPRFENTTRVSYSMTEVVEHISALRHDLVREALLFCKISGSIELTTIGDVPAGTGLGSSSSLAVGLLNALHRLEGKHASAEQLAREACEIEIDILRRPIGKQDQYAAALGGMNYLQFEPDGTVRIEPVTLDADGRAEIERHVLLLYTGQQRSANELLSKQKDSTPSIRSQLTVLRDIAAEMRGALGRFPDLRATARLLHEGWLVKRALQPGISTAKMDEWYATARAAGAWGGKLLGAGGGGFALLVAPPERHSRLIAALGHPRTLRFQIDLEGSRVIFADDGEARFQTAGAE